MSRVRNAVFPAEGIADRARPANAAGTPQHADSAHDVVPDEVPGDRGGVLRPANQSTTSDDFWTSITARESAGRSHLYQVTRDEEFKLVQRVFRLSGSVTGQTVLFAAVDDNAAGATVCGRAATLLAAHVDRSVCVADMNFREPSLHEYLGATPGDGLVDLLRDGGRVRDAAQQVSANLWLLSSGGRLSNPHTVVVSDRMRMIFKELRQQFDYIVVNAPPFSQCAESITLSQLSDGVVLVLEAHATRRERARSVKESLTAAGVPLLGVVLNNRTFPIPDVLYRRL